MRASRTRLIGFCKSHYAVGGPGFFPVTRERSTPDTAPAGMQGITAHPAWRSGRGQRAGVHTGPSRGTRGMRELSPPCQRTDKPEGLGCLCRRLQTHPMDSLLWAEPRETWVQSFHQCVSFPPHRAFLALRGVSLSAASETFLSGALASLLAEHVLWGLVGLCS